MEFTNALNDIAAPIWQGPPDHPRYAAWIKTHSSPKSTELTEWCKALMDEAAADSGQADRRRFMRIFQISARENGARRRETILVIIVTSSIARERRYHER